MVGRLGHQFIHERGHLGEGFRTPFTAEAAVARLQQEVEGVVAELAGHGAPDRLLQFADGRGVVAARHFILGALEGHLQFHDGFGVGAVADLFAVELQGGGDNDEGNEADEEGGGNAGGSCRG